MALARPRQAPTTVPRAGVTAAWTGQFTGALPVSGGVAAPGPGTAAVPGGSSGGPDGRG